jgi:hypothetical protein
MSFLSWPVAAVRARIDGVAGLAGGWREVIGTSGQPGSGVLSARAAGYWRMDAGIGWCRECWRSGGQLAAVDRRALARGSGERGIRPGRDDRNGLRHGFSGAGGDAGAQCGMRANTPK